MKNCLLSIALALLAGHAEARQSEPLDLLPADEIRHHLPELTERLEAAGYRGSIAVSIDGETVFAASIGAADPVTGMPYNLETQTDIGSITKSFTGLAASQLIAEGRLQADLPLSEWFDDVPADKANITLHQLLTHSAGFPPAIGDDLEHIGRDAFLERAFASPLLFEPGSRYEYSNVGYSIVAAIIEVATGEGFEDVLIDNVLAPVGLADTGYLRAYSALRSVRNEEGNTVDAASWGGGEPYWNLIGNGGMVSTASDMLRLGQFIDTGNWPVHGTLDLFATGYLEEGAGAPGRYGYGVVVEDDPAFGRVLWHNGGNPHFRSHWRVLDDHGVVIFTTTNSRDISADQAAIGVMAALFGVELDVQPPPRFNRDQPVDLPDTDAGRLAMAFFDALGGDPEDWRDFIENRTSEAFQNYAPMEQHLEMFGQISADVQGAEFFSVEERSDEIRVVVAAPDGPALLFSLGVGQYNGAVVLTGLGVEAS